MNSMSSYLTALKNAIQVNKKRKVSHYFRADFSSLVKRTQLKLFN